MIDEYQLLANAIVLQAANDWKRANMELKKAKPLSRKWLSWENLRKECEEFFRSEWCGELTGLDGNYILERLKKGV